LTEATGFFGEAAQIYSEMGAQGDLAYVNTGYGDITFYQGDYTTALTHYRDALARFQAAGNYRLIGRVLGQLGRIACRQGDLVVAVQLCKESLTVRRNIGHKPGMLAILEQCFAEVALATHRFEVAIRILGAVTHVRQVLNRPRSPMENTQLDLLLAQLREDFGDATFAAAWAFGETMSLDAAATSALETLAELSTLLVHQE
jgi:tetratricopeptide (TPR) repeat protein